MNWAAIAALAAIVGPVLTIAGMAFYHGRLTEKVSGNTESLKLHEGRLDDHDDKIYLHAEKIGKLEQWKDGFSAGTRVVSGRVDQ